MPIADMRQIVALIDDRPRLSGGGCTLKKQTLRPAAGASPVVQEQIYWRGVPSFAAEHGAARLHLMQLALG